MFMSRKRDATGMAGGGDDNKKVAFLLFFAPFVASILLSCSADVGFDKAYSAVSRTGDTNELLVDLIRLDQEFPDRFGLKHEVGMLYLQKGDPISAGPYLKRAETLARNRITPSERATLFGGLAIVSYANGEYSRAVEYGRKALSVKADEAAAFGFITARALLAVGKQKEAIEIFDSAWATAKTSMAREDYRAYARALAVSGRYADLIKVLDAYETSYPYEPGLGLMQSDAYERLGDFDAAVFAAFKEAEYGRAYGAAQPTDIQKNLAALGRKLDDLTFNPTGKGKKALQGVLAYAREEWLAAARLLEVHSGATVFENYLFLSARIESKRATPEEVDAYAGLMPGLRSLPPYFYRLYLGLKSLPEVSSDRLADALEAAIDLAPRSVPAMAYRGDLAVTLGLQSPDRARVLTKAELSSTAEKAAATGDPALLEPLVATLDLKDNRATLMAVGVLRAFAKDARYRPFFIDRVRTSVGRERERLEYILAN